MKTYISRLNSCSVSALDNYYAYSCNNTILKWVKNLSQKQHYRLLYFSPITI